MSFCLEFHPLFIAPFCPFFFFRFFYFALFRSEKFLQKVGPFSSWPSIIFAKSVMNFPGNPCEISATCGAKPNIKANIMPNIDLLNIGQLRNTSSLAKSSLEKKLTREKARSKRPLWYRKKESTLRSLSFSTLTNSQ